MSSWFASILIKLYWNDNETILNNNEIVKKTDCNCAWIVLKNRLLKVITRYDEIKVWGAVSLTCILKSWERMSTVKFTKVKYNNAQKPVSFCIVIEVFLFRVASWERLILAITSEYCIDGLCVIVRGVTKFNRLYVFGVFGTTSAIFF